MDKKKKPVEKIKKKLISYKVIGRLTDVYLVTYYDNKGKEEFVGIYTDEKYSSRQGIMHASYNDISIEKYKIYIFRVGESIGGKFIKKIIDK